MDGLTAILNRYLPENDFGALKIPLIISATEINKGQVKYFYDGPLVRTIEASSSIPVIFKPIDIEGALYVDGGLLDNLPVRPLTGKCDLIVGFHCNHIGHEFKSKGLKEMIERTFLLAINANTQISRSMCDVFIEPANMNQFSSFDLKRAEDIFEAGYRFTKQNFLPHHFQKPVHE
jgi:NTE family protein